MFDCYFVGVFWQIQQIFQMDVCRNVCEQIVNGVYIDMCEYVVVVGVIQRQVVYCGFFLVLSLLELLNGEWLRLILIFVVLDIVRKRFGFCLMYSVLF